MHIYHRQKTALLSHECTEHIISPSTYSTHVSMGTLFFLCGAFWDCCHQHTCYTSLEYTGLTPRRNTASSGLSTLTLHILTFWESTAKWYFPSIQLGKHLTKRAPHPAQPTPAGPSDTLLTAALTSCTHGVKMAAQSSLCSPGTGTALWQFLLKPSAYFTAGLTVCTHLWASAVCSGYLWCRSHPSCVPSEYWGSRSLFLSLTALSSLNLF